MSKKIKNALRRVEASFNIFDSGWKKFGNHRKYLTDNVDRIMNGDIVQERVERRVMVGFFGHKSNPSLEPVEDPDNLPSHLTARLKFYPASGDVEHKQEILDTKPGRAVLSLHDSRIGNFSWRGKAEGVAAPDQFSRDAARHLRFDYVYVPGMVKQSKKNIFISESASEFEAVNRRFEENGLTAEEARTMTVDWRRQGLLVEDVETQCRDMALENRLLRKQLLEKNRDAEERRALIQEAIKISPYVFSEKLLGFLSGESPESKEDVLARVEEIRAYHHLDAGRFPGPDVREKNGFLPKNELFLKSNDQEFSLENSALGIYARKF